MDTLPLVKWLNKELSTLLECEIGDEYARNILNIETEQEIKEFIGSLLDLSIPRNKNFLEELLVKLKKPSNLKDVTVYVKPDLSDQPSKLKNNKKQSQQANKSDAENINPISNLKQSKNKGSFSLFPTNQNQNKASNRHKCDCQASKHKLISNCLKCGRIVCEEEGSGPCYFCGSLVCTREELEKINRGSNKGEQLKTDLLSRTWQGFDVISDNIIASNFARLGDPNDEKLQMAIKHKDKLIDYDRTSAKRTQVFDDESDYFNTNSKWISHDQRIKLEQKEDELRDKRFGSRLKNRTVTLDFAGRKVVEDRAAVNFQNYASEIDSILDDKKNKNSNTSNNTEMLPYEDISHIAPKFIEDKSKKAKKIVTQQEEKKTKTNYRLQDSELQEMKDDGMCLSMHQPWASLLVCGIKKHEGRGWYTPYRGRLWIHAGSKEPSQSDIQEVESFYKAYYQNQSIEFPESYPTSCLLGYIDLSDVLAKDEYLEKYPDGESESEFVFICENPRELLVKCPMSGQHKIFKLDKNVHAIAKKTSVTYFED